MTKWQVVGRAAGGARWRKVGDDQWQGPNGTVRTLAEIEAAHGRSRVVEVANVHDLVADVGRLTEEATRRTMQAVAAVREEERTRQAMLVAHRHLMEARRSCDNHGTDFRRDCPACIQARLVVRALNALRPNQPAPEPEPARGGGR